jgi:hypothetical protein
VVRQHGGVSGLEGYAERIGDTDFENLVAVAGKIGPVEVASPALIERVRTATTDGSGHYKIIEVRPGTFKTRFRAVDSCQDVSASLVHRKGRADRLW